MEKTKNAPKIFWILLAIILIGIFLRTYNFQTWLDFENDQVRDAFLAGDVIQGKAAWPLLGPTMRGSWDAQSNLFHLGPMYYYFQIISGKIFGNYPDKFAYPDLLFSILTIPLFYIFFRKYFSPNLSLALTGLYAISFFAVKYSRFAWNPNSIPFFTLLLLLSLYELLLSKENTRWIWIAAAGIALGIGVQLHIILLILFPAAVFFIFLYLIKNNWKIWKKLALVIFIAAVLNFGQIASEMKSGFFNTKVFLTSAKPGNAASKDGQGMAQKLGTDFDCQLEGNAFILSSYGPSECGLTLQTAGHVISRALQNKKIKNSWNGLNQPGSAANFILGISFSIFGYFFLGYRAWKEKDEKKKVFLRLIIFYASFSFLVMLPVSERFSEFRYFIHVFFIPFLFLGILADLASRKLTLKFATFAMAAVFFALVFLNLNSIGAVAKELNSGTRSNEHYAILGEMESMIKYMKDNSGGEKEVFLVGDRPHLSHFYQPFLYLADKQNFSIVKRDDSPEMLTLGRPIFYLTDRIRNDTNQLSDYKIENYKIFGQVVIYKLEGI